MSLFRQIDFNEGSTLDRFGATATITGATFKNTEKGKAIDASTGKYLRYSSQLLPNTGPYTLVVWAKLRNTHISSDRAQIISSNNFGTQPNISIAHATHGGRPCFYIGQDNYKTFTPVVDKNWHCYVFTLPGTDNNSIESANLYVDTVLRTATTVRSVGAPGARSLFVYVGGGNTSTSGCMIAKLKVYDHILTEAERNLEYKEFLQAQITEKPVRGFELVKPTDLSYQKDRGLLLAYNMKPNGSTLVDISGNSRHGTLNGGVINTKEGLGFNGVNGYIGSITSPTYTDKLSVSVRFKPTDDTSVGYKGVVGDWNLTEDKRSWFVTKETGAGNKYEFDMSTTGSWVNGRSIKTDEALTKNLWYTLTAVYNGAKIYMYLNGVKQTEERNVTGNLFQGDLLQIGAYNSDLTRCFPGEIQDVRIYNRELTEQEIKDYHNSFIKPVILDDFSNYAVGETRPKEWQIISGEFEIKEDTEKKYLECTSNGTIKINHNTTTDADASIDYYDGASWATFSGKLSDLITTHAWLSKEGNYLEFSLTAGQAIANIKIYDGVRQ